MDQEIEQLYDVLVDVNYPVSLAELRNPTSEFMVKIGLTFLSGLSIDGKTIQRATFGQEQSLSYPEAHQEVISFINLHEVMAKISDRIFIKDFYLTDITSPGAKKARRLIRTLLNFVLYTMSKMEELIEPLDSILVRLNTLNDVTDKKNKDMELRTEIVLENSKKTALKEKYIKQIEETKRRNDKKNKFSILEERAQNAKLAKQKAQERNASIKQQVLKSNEKTTEMESTVVKSPEEYETQLRNYGQDCTDKKEKVQGMIDRLCAKRELQTQFEKVQEFVTQEYQQFPKVQVACSESKKLAKTKAEKLKQLNEIQAAVQKLHEEMANADDSSGCDTVNDDEVYAQCQGQIAPLRKAHMKVLSENQAAEKKLEEAQDRCQQSRCEKKELNKRITILEEEIAEFLKDCQDLYTSDIQKEVEIEKLWRTKHLR